MNAGKLRSRFLLGLLGWLIATSAGALQATQEAFVSVTVDPVFELTLDQGFIRFDHMRPGEVKWNIPTNALTATTKTNGQKPWFLMVSTTSELSSGAAAIPNDRFYWYGWTDGQGTFYGTKENSMTTTPVLAYASAAVENANLPGGTNTYFKFKLDLPKNQRPGVYGTTVKFTITE